METYLFWIVPIASLLALALAWYFYKQMMLESEGTPTMEKIASYVRQGAMSYLKQQYKVVGLVFLGLVILFSIMAYGFNLQNPWVPIAFLTGGFFSGLSGFLGMKTATYASARTANAAQHSLNKGLRVAFRSGAVMGLVVVGLGLLDISFWYILLLGLLYSVRYLESFRQIMCHHHYHAYFWDGSQHASAFRPCRRWNLYQGSRCGC